jgi:hypothetical protein
MSGWAEVPEMAGRFIMHPVLDVSLLFVIYRMTWKCQNQVLERN